MILSMNRTLLVVTLLSVGVGVQAQMGPRDRHGGMPHRHETVSMVRHHYVHEHGVDSRYAAMVSPLAPTPGDLERGRGLFEQNCASCHGPQGLGDGEAGAALTPAPSNLAWISGRRIATDAYLFWTIAEGGVPVGTAMPPFRAALSDNDIWVIIAHLRQL